MKNHHHLIQLDYDYIYDCAWVINNLLSFRASVASRGIWLKEISRQARNDNYDPVIYDYIADGIFIGTNQVQQRALKSLSFSI